MNSIRKTIIGAALVAVAACGGAQKKGAAGGASGEGGGGDAKAPALSDLAKSEPKREISNDARKDYEAAAAFYKDNDKGAWKESSCRQAAERFQTVARNHRELVEAHYMIGRSYHNCNLLSDAERAYQDAIKVKANHGASMSNLGEIAFRNGKTADAKRYWES